MMERCLARIEMSPQGGAAAADAAAVAARHRGSCIGTKLGNGPRALLWPTLASMVGGLVSLFMGIKRPLRNSARS